MNPAPPLHAQLTRVQQGGLVLGVVGLLLCLAGAFLAGEQFFHSYLFAYLFWVGLALGCVSILMLHHLIGGGWGFMVQRLLEAGAMTLPLMALLFIPLLFGLREIYVWARPEVVVNDLILQQRSPYMNVPFFLARALLYFAIWSILAFLLSHWSREQDRTGNPVKTLRLRRVSMVGLLLYIVTASFAAIDWGMSIEPYWYSAIYGLLFIIGQALAAFAFVAIILSLLARRASLAGLVTPRHLKDFGNLLLVFVLLSAYFSFSQYLIIWAGNLPYEVTWYLARGTQGWEWVALFLVIFHFVMPFLVLLSRRVRLSTTLLAVVASLLLFMRLVDVFWYILPTFYPAFRVHWLDLVAPLAIGGLWVAFFAWQLKGRPLVPIEDPRLQEVVADG
jgi:hypothetical protein